MENNGTLSLSFAGQIRAVPFAKEELAIQRQKFVTKVVCLTLLAILAAATFSVGVGLTIALTNPAFLVLFIATALLTVIAIVSYFHLTEKPTPDWEKVLQSYFSSIPAHTVYGGGEQSTEQLKFDFYCSKSNPQIKLGIQTDFTPFSAIPRVLPKKGEGKGAMIFNTIDPRNAKIAQTTNLSHAIYAKMHRDWLTCDTRDGTINTPEPFFPTEARVALCKHFKEGPSPMYLGHVRGPKVDEFPEEDEETKEHYYTRAFCAYVKCLEKAIEAKVSVVALPLFSSAYEIPLNEKRPKSTPYTWPIECNLFCKKALLEAIHHIALKFKKTSLLVLLQDPYAPLANTVSEEETSD
ncbi:hypothetical protein [Chlamydia pecorum]|uniref:hypothetical protein n=1 Tax=Chlamydia pecorum TaxID=85991 RepID=UPI0007AEECBA|nr:hypothetical protein [Chlamydia pecorum]KZN27688.1 hypothetical protein cpL17_0619 [Chlamydia pecorum]